MIWVRRLGMYVVLVVLIACVYGVLSILPGEDPSGSGVEAVQRAPLKRIDVLKIEPRIFTDTIVVPGTVEAEDDILLSAAISGLVESVNIEEGQRVQAGDVLIQIDQRTRQTVYDDAQAALNLANRELERLETLRERGDVTIQEYDRAVTAQQQATYAVNRARVERSLGMVTAPIDGVIDRVDVEVGEYATEGLALSRLLDIERVEVIAGVPERFAGQVRDGDRTEVEFEALAEIRQGVLERVALAANLNTNTYEARIVLDNQGYSIRPGMIARTRLQTRTVPDALMVPLLALVKRENGMVVFVENNGTVEERPVQLGAIQDAEIEVLAGVCEGDSVVVVGQQDLVHGQAVEVMQRLDTLIQTAPVLEVR